MRLDDGVCSGLFTVEQGLRQGYVRASSLFDIFYVAFIDMAYTRFKADEDIMDAFVHLKKKPRAWGSSSRRAIPGDVTLGHALL